PLSVAPAAGLEICTDGAVVSAFWTSTETLAAAEFPLVSIARAVIVWVPSASEVVSTPSVQDEVPVAGWGSPPSTLTDTPARPPASAAVPETETRPPTVAPPEGAEIVTTGGVVSALGLPLPPPPPGLPALAVPAVAKKTNPIAAAARRLP